MLLTHSTGIFPMGDVPAVCDKSVSDIKFGKKKIRLFLWDTAGQEDFSDLRLISYQRADLFLICFSLVDINSFHNAINKWFYEVKEENPRAIKILAGTKLDLAV